MHKYIYKVVILFVILLFFQQGFSQKSHLITLKPQKIDFKNNGFYIGKVLDKRPKKTGLGAVQIGQKWVKVNFSRPFIYHLQDAFNKLVPYEKSFVPLTLVIHDLSLTEELGENGEKGKIEIEIEVCYPDSIISIAKIHSIKQSDATDVTRKHPKIILASLEDCIKQINEIYIDKKLHEHNFKTLNFNSNRSIKKGLFRNVTAFLTDTPENDIQFEIKKVGVTGKYDRFAAFYPNKNKRIKGLFGFSDGKDIYINVAEYSNYESGTYFVKSEFLGEHIYFEDRISDRFLGYTFGVGGALLSLKKVGVVLNTNNGQISKLDRDYLVETLKEYPELRKKYNQTKKKLVHKKMILKELNQVLRIGIKDIEY